jgi:hypothetical protein
MLSGPCYCGQRHYIAPDGPGQALKAHLLGRGYLVLQDPDTKKWRAEGPRLRGTGPWADTVDEALDQALVLLEKQLGHPALPPPDEVTP